ncbi:MAG: adenylate cyclase, partial [Anaerolineae bacterium]|nr:adenylate cyclase [Anaerolineae bacterium]
LIHFRYFDLMLPLAEAVAGLNQFQPDWLVGPPSLLGYLADAREQGQLRLRPRRLISVAEVLEPQDQARLASVFDAPVHQIYQCTEGLLGVSCAYGRLHLQADLVAFQFEPVDGDEAEPGQPERVTPIVTDLWRTTQPILRYRLNDILRLDPRPCPCGSGFQVVEAIEGRSDDVLLFEQTAGGRRPVFPDTLRRAILLAHAAIRDYRVCQTGPDALHVYLSPMPDADPAQVADAVRSSLMDTLASYGCRLTDIEVSLDIPPLPPGVKRRRVQRLWRDNGAVSQSTGLEHG